MWLRVPVSCQSVNLVYVVTCPCGLQYVGKTSNPRNRWSNHKSHIRNNEKTCNLATHCIEKHRDRMVGTEKLRNSTDIKSNLQFTILQSVGLDGTEDELELIEEHWRSRLKSWAPFGLNIREDGPTRLRRKTLKVG